VTIPVDGTGRQTAVRLINDVPATPPDLTPPTITRAVPWDDDVYSTGEIVDATFSCSDPNLVSCEATVDGVGSIKPGDPIDTATPGQKNFRITAIDAAGNGTYADTTYHVVTGTPGPVEVAAGDSITVGAASPGDPYAVDLQTSNTAGGPVSITVSTDGATAPTGYSVMGATYKIEAPAGSSASPLTITFRMDATVLEAADVSWDTVQMLRDGVALASCAVSAVPCVDAQYLGSDGDLVISVRTDHASTWQSAVRTDLTVTGFFAPVDNPALINTVKAGAAVPVKFALGGNKGMNVLASGSPSSGTMNCNKTAFYDDIEQTVSTASSTLTYDAASQRYTYAWKTQKGWAGTCRQLTVRFADGTERTAWFKLTK
jgi:hypothetical protein